MSSLSVRGASSGQQAEDPRRLAEVQAALKRVATLVAGGPPPSEVFAAVAAEVGQLLAVPIIAMFRYDSGDQATVLGSWGPTPYQLGAEVPLDGPSVTATVLRTGRPARIDNWTELSGTIADAVRQTGVCSVVGAPIVVEGSTWGLVAAASIENALPPETESRLSEFTSLVATALSNAQSREDLSRYVEEQAALRRVATLVASGADPDEVFGALAEGVAGVLSVPAISMIRYENDGTATKVGGWGDVLVPVGTRWELDDPSVMAEVARTGSPARIDDYRSVPGAHARGLRERGIMSSVGAPIVVNGASWGAIVAFSSDSSALAEDAEERLARFTELVGTAVSNAQASDDLRRLAEEQAALRRVAVLVAEGTAPEAVFAAVAQEVAHLLDVPAISMVRFEPDESSTAIAVWGNENPFGVGATFEPWPGVMLQVRQTGRPARLEDFAYSTGPTTTRLLKARIHSGVGVPVNVDGEVWGTIIALATGGESLPSGIEARLSSFTELVGTAIANTQARDDARRLSDEQAALRRVATLVAQGADPRAVFDMVCKETGPLFGATSTNLCYFTPDGFNLTLSGWSLHDTHIPTGTRLPLDGDTINVLVQRTGAPGRVDTYEGAAGELAALLRARGVRAEVGAPVIVQGKTWGALIAGWDTDGPAPAGIETRVAGFAELIATAIANAQARDQLDVFVREQEALRRVATIAAAGASPQEVFDAVVDEIKELLDLPVVALTRYESDGMVLMLAAAGPHPFQKGTRWPLEGLPVASKVLERGEPAYLEEYVTENPTTGPAIETAKVRSGLAVPIIVENKVWGTISTASTDVPLPPDTEKRLVGFTELVATAVLNAQARDELHALVDEQASLRRVATLVAEGAPPADVFEAVAEEVAHVSGLPLVEIARFDPDGTMTVVGHAGDHPFRTGTQWPLDNLEGSAAILESGKAIRVEYTDDLPGLIADTARKAGMRWALGVPIVVGGRVWGSIGVARDDGGDVPAGAESRLAGFTELVATAISNTTNHSQLLASRARIVAAADEARRRIERNLHDGTQQQLVALGLDLQGLMLALPPSSSRMRAEFERVQGELGSVIDDVREISRGVHPALLSHSGLGAAIKALARRSPIPVDVEIGAHSRLPQSIEIAAYYVVSEALANAAKHSEATVIRVNVVVSNDRLAMSITDNGVGGARVQSGTGLVGLIDRVEALGGSLSLKSPAGEGTAISVDLPLEEPQIAS